MELLGVQTVKCTGNNNAKFYTLKMEAYLIEPANGQSPKIRMIVSLIGEKGYYFTGQPCYGALYVNGVAIASYNQKFIWNDPNQILSIITHDYGVPISSYGNRTYSLRITWNNDYTNIYVPPKGDLEFNVTLNYPSITAVSFVPIDHQSAMINFEAYVSNHTITNFESSFNDGAWLSGRDRIYNNLIPLQSYTCRVRAIANNGLVCTSIYYTITLPDKPSSFFIKKNEKYAQATAYIKVNGIYKKIEAIYKKIGGKW